MGNEAVALYLRLSREDEEKVNESESIKNQRNFLIDYTRKMGWTVAEIYTDDGASGTNFDRPGFLKLIADIEKGKINTVISKDLSRLGRDYIQTGYYLEKYFPLKGVRFIAVNDSIDTENEDSSSNDMSPFRSVINDMYARDISKKIRTALTTKKKNGKFIGSCAPFGYVKDPLDKGHLIIDEETAPIVREIYSLCLNGKNIIAIAKLLTEKKIPTPSMSKGKMPTQKRFSGLWNDSMVKRILTNETYIGNLTQNRSRKVGYKLDKKVNLDRKDWIVVKGTHEGIIGVEDFMAVQKILGQRTYVKKEQTKEAHLLSGLVYCGKCDSPMTFVKESSSRTYLVCSSWKKYGRLGLCSSHCIREDYVEDILLSKLKELTEKLDLEAITEKILIDFKMKKPVYKNLNSMEEKSEFYKKAQIDLYKDKVRGIISEDMFVEMSRKFTQEYEEFNRLPKLRREEQKALNESGIRKKAIEFLEFKAIERSMLLLLVDKIRILDNKKIEIYFTFKSL